MQSEIYCAVPYYDYIINIIVLNLIISVAAEICSLRTITF